MDRVVRKIAAAAVALLLASAAGAADAVPRGGKRTRPPRDAVRRLDEVRIVGNPERPEVLFFLPRAKFRLLPMATGVDWRGEIGRNDIEKADLSR